MVGELELHIALANLIDINAEIARLNKEIKKLQADITNAKTKLANSNYINKAPAAVVAKDKAKLAENLEALEKRK